MHYKYFLMTCILLSGCNTATLSKAQSAALGEQPNFRGTITDWAKGDAIAPGDGGIFATTYTGDPDGMSVGFGSIKANGSFTFGLQRGASSADGGLPVEQALCTGLKLSKAKQKIVLVDTLEVSSLYTDGHARPGGTIFISVAQPKVASPATLEVYTFIHADSAGKIKGSCTMQDVGPATFNLDLHKGWNSVRRTLSGFTTAAIPRTAKWYFFSTLTFGQ